MPALIFLACFAGWVTHLVTCLGSGSWGFLIAGAIAAPVGVFHGFGIWLGIF